MSTTKGRGSIAHNHRQWLLHVQPLIHSASTGNIMRVSAKPAAASLQAKIGTNMMSRMGDESTLRSFKGIYTARLCAAKTSINQSIRVHKAWITNTQKSNGKLPSSGRHLKMLQKVKGSTGRVCAPHTRARTHANSCSATRTRTICGG